MSEEIDSEEYPEELNTNCRIGKVTYKDTKLVAFPNTLRPSRERQVILEMVLNMLDNAPEDFDGWALLGWNKDYTQVYSQWDFGSVPPVTGPEFVKRNLEIAIEEYDGSKGEDRGFT